MRDHPREPGTRGGWDHPGTVRTYGGHNDGIEAAVCLSWL